MKERDTNGKVFPKGFFWGASTSAHQVEGGLKNQWSVWELANASELARTAKDSRLMQGVPRWEHIRSRAESPENYVSDRGIEHFKRYKKDFQLLKELNLNAFRFGLEWSRLEPEQGKWDDAAFEHYRRYIRELRHLDIEPFPTLWHWTVPTWFTDQGGFTKKNNIRYFERFVQKVADELGDELDHIITLNEPNVYTAMSYMLGEWPPEEKSLLTGVRVYRNLVRTHRRAYMILKAANPELQIGIAANLINFYPQRPGHLYDRLATRIMSYIWNWCFLRRIRRQQDFVGVNFYLSEYFKGFKRQTPKQPVSDLGWHLRPGDLHPLLLEVWRRFHQSVIITENGLADERDKYRKWWLEESIAAMKRALKDGVDVKGYLHWSLLDNFEWKFGWWPKFGLVAVDRDNLKRTIRPSAKWFADVIKRESRSSS